MNEAALRTAGLEVWFDQSELVGGDQWDARIHREISACALFLPITTQARREGYFRLGSQRGSMHYPLASQPTLNRYLR